MFLILQDFRGKDMHNFNIYYLTKDVSSFGMLPKNIHFSLAKQNYIPKRLTTCVETKKWQTQFLLICHLL